LRFFWLAFNCGLGASVIPDVHSEVLLFEIVAEIDTLFVLKHNALFLKLFLVARSDLLSLVVNPEA